MSCCDMKIDKEGNILNIELGKRLDKSNADDVLKQIGEQLDDSIESLQFDAANLKKISSEGLDVLLELKLKYKNILMNNVHMGICDVFEAYGLSEKFVQLNKVYRFVSVEGCEVIGHGGHGTMYKIGEDTIVKVYRDNSPLETIENERRYARNAFINGIPTAIAYDVVETEQGYGVVFEMLGGLTLGRFLEQNPDKLEEYSIKFAELLLKLNSTIADAAMYKDFHDIYLERTERAKRLIGDEAGEKVKKIINSIPRGEGMIHGDYHPNNVMVDSDGELLLIDMADISRGNGFFDIGGTSLILDSMARRFIMRKRIHQMTNMDYASCIRMWDIVVRHYYDTEDEEELKKINEWCTAFGDIRIAASLGMNTSHSKLIDALMIRHVKKNLIPKTNQYIELFEEMQ